MIIQYNTLSNFSIVKSFDDSSLFLVSKDIGAEKYRSLKIESSILYGNYKDDIQQLSSEFNGNWTVTGKFILPNVPSVDDQDALSSAVTKDWCEKNLISKLNELSAHLFGDSNFIPSYIGQVIVTRTLKTSNEVCKKYGGLEWKQIKGRFLFGVGSNAANNLTSYGTCAANEIEITRASRNGGINAVSLKSKNVPGHTHTVDGCKFGNLPEKDIAMEASASATGQYGVVKHVEMGKNLVPHKPVSAGHSNFWGHHVSHHDKGLYASPDLISIKEILGSDNISLSFSFTPKATVTAAAGLANGTAGPHGNMPKFEAEYIWERVR